MSSDIIIVITQYFNYNYRTSITSKLLLVTFFAHFCIVRSRERKQPYFVNHIKDWDRTKIPAQKLAEPAGLHKASRKSSFRNRCNELQKNGRVVALSFCDGMYRAGLFKNMGKFVGSRREVQKIGEPLIRATPMMPRPRVREVQEGNRQSSAQRGIPPPRPDIPPSSSHPFILSVTPSLAPAANLKQQVPTPLLRGSRSPSGFLLPVADVYVARSGRGFRF